MEKLSTTFGQPPRRETIKVSALFAAITIPLLLLAAAISIPWTYIQKFNHRRKERGCAGDMRKANRLMEWQDFHQAMQRGAGTAIGEYLSPNGPFRLWWTPDEISATSPHKWKREPQGAWIEQEFLPFFQWCYGRYTNAQSGVAFLVPVPEELRNQLNEILTSGRFVSTCSFRSIREVGS
jgi:hypothetical protein